MTPAVLESEGKGSMGATQEIKAIFRKYEPLKDFLRVRDMLVETYRAFERPINWPIVRWQYARHFCAPMLGAYGSSDSIDDSLKNNIKKSKQAIRLWENAVGIWENENKEIVAVVCPDEYVPWHPGSGLAFFQRRPGYDSLLDEMLEYSQKKFIKESKSNLWIPAHDKPLQDAAIKHGFKCIEKSFENWLEYDLKNLPGANLPVSFRFQSMADNNDLERRRKVLGLSFYHKDPKEWATIFSYQELQRAPDYRKDLDLVVVAPDGEFVSCCIAWVDTKNEIAMLEPVGSIVLGMGREVVLEGLRRARNLGAKTGIMETRLKYYEKIGFVKKYVYGHIWQKEVSEKRSPGEEKTVKTEDTFH